MIGHRCLVPDQMMINNNEAQFQVKLADFGFSMVLPDDEFAD